MFSMIRTLVTLAVLAAFIWVGATVPLGERTLFGHISNIWSAEETQQLVDGVKDKSGPVVDRVRRGVEAGLREASGDAGGDNAEPAPTEKPSSPDRGPEATPAERGDQS